MFHIILVSAVVFGLIQHAPSHNLSKEEAIRIGERFVLENGYTSAPPELIKQQLDHESIEWQGDRKEMLQHRYNSLKPKAIGAKRGRKGETAGWSVAFDRVAGDSSSPATCRVVTMDDDGSNMRMEHVDGVRNAFAEAE